MKLKNPVKTIIACVLAWAVPGLGHLYLKKSFRSAVFFVSFALLFWMGLRQQGKIYSLESLDFFAILKFFDNLSMGVIYFWARSAGVGQGNITAFTFEYGNTFLLTAGLLNMLFVVDVFDIAQERKS
ncbi:MAG TPA: DUF6677 family protein [Acidobacteriota bacterium]|jgi:hypothetical protein|nr:DUF6677 family protein [Acidobacteriota bacterium]